MGLVAQHQSSLPVTTRFFGCGLRITMNANVLCVIKNRQCGHKKAPTKVRAFLFEIDCA